MSNICLYKKPDRMDIDFWLYSGIVIGISQPSVAESMMNRADLLLLLAAFVSFLLSVSLWFLGKRDEGMFVGLWVPSILALGAYLRIRVVEARIHV